jgi:hypothetical protein
VPPPKPKPKKKPAFDAAVRYPRSRIDKLGITPGARVAVVGLEDAAFLAELGERGAQVVGRVTKDLDAVFVAMSAPKDLAQLVKLRHAIRPAGMIWVIWPKGRKEFREDDVRNFGPRAELVDVKVMAFSETLSGLKMVVPLAKR